MSSLAELNRHLFAALDRLDDDTMSPETIEAEVKRATAIVAVADQINATARIALDGAKLYAAHGEKVLPHLPQVADRNEPKKALK